MNSTYWKDNGQSTMQRKLLFCVLCFHILFVRKTKMSVLHYFWWGISFFLQCLFLLLPNWINDAILNIWSQYEIISWPIQVNYYGTNFYQFLSNFYQFSPPSNYTSFKKYKHWGCIFLILYESTHIVRSDAFNVLSDILDDYIICKAT